MKKIYCTFGSLIVSAILISGMVSCGENSKEGAAKTTSPAKTAQTSSTSGLPNYRYVDVDSILAKYNLAKDYNEEMMRMQTSAESQMKQHETKIQSFAQQVQNKMQNNGYLTKESYEADEKTMANMQNDAQRSMASLQENLAKAADQAQKTINDSITAFIENYNKTRGYDAIFYKNATLYINPALDITDEVIEGLNARYNKVKK